MIYIMKDIMSGMKIKKVMKKHSITATLVLAILQIQSQQRENMIYTILIMSITLTTTLALHSKLATVKLRINN